MIKHVETKQILKQALHEIGDWLFELTTEEKQEVERISKVAGYRQPETCQGCGKIVKWQNGWIKGQDAVGVSSSRFHCDKCWEGFADHTRA